MANIVNLQQAEYDQAEAELKKLHEEVLTSLTDIMKEIRTLVEADGGFYFKSTSGKIDKMLNELESEILTDMESDFLSFEEEMDRYSGDIVLTDAGMNG